jgi:predicted GNAT family N-acyltransferase
VTTAVRRARDPQEVGAALELRRAVFVEEQGVPLAEDLDGRDAEALHLVAVDDGAVVGTCRLLFDEPDVKLGRMAVASAARGAGLGAALLERADTEARLAGAGRIVLAAQLPALPLYERAGYVARGYVFLDAGIEHVWMEKRLA